MAQHGGEVTRKVEKRKAREARLPLGVVRGYKVNSVQDLSESSPSRISINPCRWRSFRSSFLSLLSLPRRLSNPRKESRRIAQIPEETPGNPVENRPGRPGGKTGTVWTTTATVSTVSKWLMSKSRRRARHPCHGRPEHLRRRLNICGLIIPHI